MTMSRFTVKNTLDGHKQLLGKDTEAWPYWCIMGIANEVDEASRTN